jgi:hypothetical protein
MPTGRRSGSGGRPVRSGRNTAALIEIIMRDPRRTGRDQSEQLVAIRRNEWSRSSECAGDTRKLRFSITRQLNLAAVRGSGFGAGGE